MNIHLKAGLILLGAVAIVAVTLGGFALLLTFAPWVLLALVVVGILAALYVGTVASLRAEGS